MAATAANPMSHGAQGGEPYEIGAKVGSMAGQAIMGAHILAGLTCDAAHRNVRVPQVPQVLHQTVPKHFAHVVGNWRLTVAPA
jgi:hypothetical protein